MCWCQFLVCMSKTTQFQQYLKCVSVPGESQWTFNAVGEFTSERNHRVLSVPCLSNVHRPHGPSECQRIHVSPFCCWAGQDGCSEAVPADQSSKRLYSASTVTALDPDSHSLLSVGFISLTRRTMNENYGPSCTKTKLLIVKICTVHLVHY